jgi:ribosomal protein S18 acetylase RimI-like enzyme
MKEQRELAEDIVVRNFRPEDYEMLVRMWEESGLPYKPAGRDKKENITREIRRRDAVFLVVEKNGQLIGSAFGTHDGRKGWINRVAVLPAFRRCGIAAFLVRELEKRISSMGIGIIACLIEEWNDESIKFFEKIGYTCHKDIFYFTKRRHPDI